MEPWAPGCGGSGTCLGSQWGWASGSEKQEVYPGQDGAAGRDGAPRRETPRGCPLGPGRVAMLGFAMPLLLLQGRAPRIDYTMANLKGIKKTFVERGVTCCQSLLPGGGGHDADSPQKPAREVDGVKDRWGSGLQDTPRKEEVVSGPNL